MKPIRNETTLVLLAAAIFSAIAIFLLSGFLEPSQPPAVEAVQVGNRVDGDAARDGRAPAGGTNPQAEPEPQRRARQRSAPARPAPPAPADDAADDDGEAD